MTNIIRLVDDGGSTYIADYKWQTYRFLLSNGNTIDVKAIQDNSVVREAVLKLANKVDKLPERGNLGISISGSCTLPEPAEVEEEKAAPKKRPAKRPGRARAAALEEQSA
jgi:hypothetical protein